jgi:hypothetical protein
LMMGQQDGLPLKFFDLVNCPFRFLLLQVSALVECVDAIRQTVIVFASVKSNELNCFAFISKAEECKLLVEVSDDVVLSEVIVEGPSEGVVVVISGNGIVPEIGPDFLKLIEL